jgi:alpha-tubulin suppressor-like RCC1 family protein
MKGHLLMTGLAWRTLVLPLALLFSTTAGRAQNVAAWGANALGQTNVSPSATNVIAIAAGPFHGLALNADGGVVAWGRNWEGQTGVPAQATNVLAVAAGWAHSLALRADGTVVAWGDNSDGQTNVPMPATNVVSIAAGETHSLALRADGTVVAWGSNEFGQTNVPSRARGLVAITAGYHHNLGVRSDHTVVAWGLENTVPASATNVVAVAGGWWHSIALRADGTVVAWGDNSYGQCMIPAAATNVVGIAAGYYHSLALRSDGTVVTWGGGDISGGLWGLTNVPAGLGDVASIAAGEDYNLAIINEGPPRFSRQPGSTAVHVGGQVILGTGVSGTHPLSLQWFHDGEPVGRATNSYLLLANVQLEDAGDYFLIATSAAGETNSQTATLTVMSDPAVAEVLTPRNVLVGTSVCLTADVYGAEPLSCQWRLNGRDLADGGRISGATSRVLCLSATTGEDSGSYSVVVTNEHGCVTGLVAQIAVSPIMAWGDNAASQLDVPIGTSDIVSIAAGANHSLALRASGTVAAWGDNSSGQSAVPQSAQNIVAVAAGETHSLALRVDGSVVAWGDNSCGQTSIPPSATNVLSIAAGRSHSLALRLGGSVVAWGSNSFGRVSVPSSVAGVAAIAAGGDSNLALLTNGTLLAWTSTTASTLATNIVSIAAGGNHTLALRADGTLFAWGGNYYGQASVPTSLNNAVGLTAGGDHSLALLANGSVVSWGADYFGQASVPPLATNILALSAGSAHSLALLGNGAQRPAFQPLETTIPIGQPTVLSAGSLSGSLVSYQWQLNGVALPGATNPVLSIGFVNWANAGTYQLVMSNAFGCVTGPPIILTVLRTPLVFDNHPQGIHMTNGEAHLRLSGASGVGPVVLLASSDLLTWETVLTNPPVIGSVEFMDSGAAGQGRRFYRGFEGAVAGSLRIDFAAPARASGSPSTPLRLTGLTANGPVVIYACSNLLDWSAIFTNPPTIGPLQYLEEPSTVPSQRFYRASENH